MISERGQARGSCWRCFSPKQKTPCQDRRWTCACLVGGICHQRRGERPCVIFPQMLDLAHNPNSRLECPPTVTVVRECRY